MKAKAFVCLHDFGDHSGGRRPGFSAALCRAVEARLGAKTVWKEVLWDGLLGSPDSSGTLDRALQTLARGLAPEAKALVMLAPPMDLFNRPEGKEGRLLASRP